MQLCFHGATTMNASLETDIAVTAQAGFAGLEVWTNKLDAYLAQHTLSDLKALFTTHGVQPMTLNSLENVSFQGPAFSSTKAHCRTLCEMAVAIGSNSIAVIPSPKPYWNVPWQIVLEEHVRALRELADIAAPYGITLAFEFIGNSGYSVRTARGAWQIIEASDRRNIGLVVDVAHCTIGGSRIEELEHLDINRICALHLNDVETMTLEAYSEANRVMPGQGLADSHRIAAKLAALGYDGPVTVELFRPEYWQRDPLEVARMAKQAALEVLTPHFVMR